MKTYAVRIAKGLFRVRGRVNAKGFLEWKTKDGCSGITGADRFCLWAERKQRFPECKDEEE